MKESDRFVGYVPADDVSFGLNGDGRIGKWSDCEIFTTREGTKYWARRGVENVFRYEGAVLVNIKGEIRKVMANREVEYPGYVLNQSRPVGEKMRNSLVWERVRLYNQEVESLRHDVTLWVKESAKVSGKDIRLMVHQNIFEGKQKLWASIEIADTRVLHRLGVTSMEKMEMGWCVGITKMGIYLVKDGIIRSVTSVVDLKKAGVIVECFFEKNALGIKYKDRVDRDIHLRLEADFGDKSLIEDVMNRKAGWMNNSGVVLL